MVDVHPELQMVVSVVAWVTSGFRAQYTSPLSMHGPEPPASATGVTAADGVGPPMTTGDEAGGVLVGDDADSGRESEHPATVPVASRTQVASRTRSAGSEAGRARLRCIVGGRREVASARELELRGRR
jgi:hypothetical protein